MSPGRPKLSKTLSMAKPQLYSPLRGIQSITPPTTHAQTLNNLTPPERLAELAVITLRLESSLGSTIHTMQAPHRTYLNGFLSANQLGHLISQEA